LIYDALIVGLGPVGATLANLLARRGLRVGVVEAEREIYDQPRAITMDHEVMRIFQACGLAHRIEPFTAAHPGTSYLGVDGGVIKRVDSQPPPYPLAWPPTGSLVQPAVEAILREALAATGNDVFLGVPALDFAQDADGVTLAAGSADGPERTLRARYLLACDGANSFVRKKLDIPLEDLAFDEWWMVVDVRVLRPVDLPAKSIQYCWPERPASFVMGPGNLRRWEIKLLPGEDPAEFGRPENVVRQLSRFVDPSCIEVWRSAVYRFHALLAERWREGRVFLLGDACHQTPPFLGQGLCAGMRDASNLAWKLAMVVRNDAPDALLDSYELERKPHVRTVVATAKQFGLIIGELDPAAARRRDQTLRAQLERGEAETIRQRYIPGLAAGVIDPQGSSGVAGTLFVQPRVTGPAGAGRLLDDLLDFRFLIATASPDAQAWLSPAARETWRRLGGERITITQAREAPAGADGEVLQVVEDDGLFAAWAQGHGCKAAVVRPDRYVFGVANDAHELNRLVAAVAACVLRQPAHAHAQ